MKLESVHDIELLLQELRNEEAFKRKAAAEELGTFDWSDERILIALEKVASSDSNKYVASAARQSLESPIHQELINKTGHKEFLQKIIDDARQAESARQPKKIERPIIITIICVIGFIWSIVFLILLPTSWQVALRFLGTWNLSQLVFLALVLLVNSIGLWQMKKWAAYTCTALYAINQVELLVLGHWRIESLLSVSGIVAYIAYRNLSKMS
jgi:hypothetical protein